MSYPLAAVIVLAAACRPDAPTAPGAPPSIHVLSSTEAGWSAPVNLGPPVNTALAENDAFTSKDGLSLYFVANDRPGGQGGFDIWVSQRASIDDPWGEPKNLGPTVNTSANEAGPALSIDGHRLFFHSGRPGGFGSNDLYVSRRRDKRDDFGWRPAENLGSAINTAASESHPARFEDDATETGTLYFTSNRAGGPGLDDIYVSNLLPDAFGMPVLVAELSSPSNDRQPAIRRDGLEMFLTSDRPGTVGAIDVWVATRSRTSDPWSTPINLGIGVNSPTLDGRPSLSFDGTTLYFQSNRPGGAGMFDLYLTTRAKPHADE